MEQTKLEQQKELQERLIFIFGNVNEWLKFAEAKNAGLFAFTGAAIFGLLSFKTSSANLYDAWKAGINIGVVFLLASAAVSLSSFFPQTVRARAKSSRQKGLPRYIRRTRVLLKNKRYRSDHNNLLFYVELVLSNKRYCSNDLFFVTLSNAKKQTNHSTIKTRTKFFDKNSN